MLWGLHDLKDFSALLLLGNLRSASVHLHNRSGEFLSRVRVQGFRVQGF